MQEIGSSSGTDARHIWQRATWYRALTLPERLAALREHTPSSPLSIDHDDALRRLQRWKSQPPFNKGDYFAQRLALDELTSEELLSLLAMSPDDIQAQISRSPSWLARLSAVFEEQLSGGNGGLQHSEGDERPEVAFLNTIRPLLMDGLNRLRCGIQELVQAGNDCDLPFDPATLPEQLFAHLSARLLPRMSSTIVLELNVARMQGNLQGDTPQERFQRYLSRLAHPEHMLPLLEEYVVLARFIVETIDRWIICELEMLKRLCADWHEIVALFTPDNNPGQLVNIDVAGDDSYRGGHAVMLLTWSSGFRLVYKPRSLAVDAHFQEVLAWCNARGFQPAFRISRILNKDGYAWSEFVTAASCNAPEEIERFYMRQGAYLALLYALNANDIHAGNVIAAGEYPMLIDLEALLQPGVPLLAHEQSLDMSEAQESCPLLQIGLLPTSDQRSPGADMSGMGDSSGQLTPEAVAVWRGVGTDEMRLAPERVELPAGLHRPRLLAADVDTSAYHDQVAAGFGATYRLLIQHKDELLTQLLPRFAHDEVRCLLRDSEAYALILKDSFHPNMLRDALDRDRLLDRLWLAVEHEPWLARVIAAERNDLYCGDTPLYVAHPATRDLYTSSGQRIPDFFTTSGLAIASARVQSLDEHDLQSQLSIIRDSFTSLKSSPTQR